MSSKKTGMSNVTSELGMISMSLMTLNGLLKGTFLAHMEITITISYNFKQICTVWSLGRLEKTNL